MIMDIRSHKTAPASLKPRQHSDLGSKPVHLKKLCVGVKNPEELAQWQALRQARGERLFHRTRNFPRRGDAIVNEGALYWIISGYFAVRQDIVALEPVSAFDPLKQIYQSYCDIVFAPLLYRVRPLPHRPFQGWRYLEDADKPADTELLGNLPPLPPEMERELLHLGVL